MRILHIIPSSSPEVGGPIAGVLNLSRAYIKMGHTVTILCGDSSDSPWIKDHKFNIIGLGPSIFHYAFVPGLVKWLIANSSKYDVVIVNGIWQYQNLAIFIASYFVKIKYFVFPHGMLDPNIGKIYPIKNIKKYFYWFFIERFILKRAQAVIFTCELESILASKNFKPYDLIPKVMNYGINYPPTNAEILKDNFLNKYAHLKSKKLFLFLSRLHNKKGCELLISAFSDFYQNNKEYHLVMAGPGDSNYVSKLKNLALDLKVSESITFTGMLSADDKFGALASADLFCLPSFQENFGIAVAESLSCGTPVLISNNVNIWPEIKNFNAGLVVNNNILEIKNSMIEWDNFDLFTKSTMKLNAKNCFISNFHIDMALSSLINIISK